MTYYDGVDLLWSDDGDYILGRNGDIGDTSFEPLLAVIQDCYDRIKSDKGDYAESPKIGASLSDDVGEPNDAETALDIQKRIMNAMSIGTSINPGDVSIQIFPVNIHQVAVKFRLAVQPSSWNNKAKTAQLYLLYCYHENNVYPANSFPETI